MKKITIAVMSALGLAVTPVMAQDAGAGDNASAFAFGDYTGSQIAGAAVILASTAAIVGESSSSPQLPIVGDDDDDDDDDDDEERMITSSASSSATRQAADCAEICLTESITAAFALPLPES
ncbi:MAG: hypothetical protein LAT77_11310, partial [Aliidiomarina sp.]|uniref:hypothetical protein n=1 Tax=Aliidiomarina sp. TaxID=1872439 RepID=UPI0025BCA367